MKKNQHLAFSIALLGSMIVLFGCDKTNDTVRPQAASISQNATPTEVDIQAQNNWLFYLERIEQGDIIDPTGQYVAKSSYVGPIDDEQDDNVQASKGEDRPKFDAVEGTVDWGYSKYIAQGGKFGLPKETACEDCLVAESTGSEDKGNRPAVTSRFDSSTGQGPYSGGTNPNGYIYDVKIVKGRSSNQSALPGYTIIPLDLNKGAGGQYIYLMFTRNPGSVQYGDEIQGSSGGYSHGYRVVGPVRKMSSYSQRVGAGPAQGFNGWRGAVPTWTEWRFGWKQPDLNDGAGGRFIYGYQGKGDNDGLPVEIGVISGNSSRIAPPAGWRKIDGSDIRFPGVDLNEGAGGDYIYFCIR